MTENYVMITDKIIKEIDLNNEYAFYDKEDCECVCNLLNTKDKEISRLKKENEKLKRKINGLKSELVIWKEDANEHIQEINKLFEINEQLKEEINYLKGQLKAYSEVSPEGKWILNKGDVE